MRKRRIQPTLNAGSMADIAFLLLIFFLVVTTIVKDKGIPVILPEYYEGEPGEAADRNVLNVLVNGNDDLLVEKRPLDIKLLTETVKEFVLNPRGESDKPRSTDKAIISLQNDVNTSYETYILVYSQIHEAYKQLRLESAMTHFGKPYVELTIAEKNIILEKLPLKLSEADPFKA